MALIRKYEVWNENEPLESINKVKGNNVKPASERAYKRIQADGAKLIYRPVRVWEIT